MNPNVDQRLKAAQTAQQKLNEAVFNITKSDPWYPVRIGESEYKLEYSFGAVTEMFQKTGITIGPDDIQTTVFADPQVLLVALGCGLRTHQPDITDTALAAILNMRHRVYYAFCIQQALTATQPDVADILKEMSDKTEDEGTMPPLVAMPIW